MAPDSKIKDFSETAVNFWNLFLSLKNSDSLEGLKSISSQDKIRHRALIGFTALEAALAAHWQAEILPQWPDLLCLISALKSSQYLETLNPREKSQLMDSLNFIKGTTQPNRFSPSLYDYGILWKFLHAENSPVKSKMWEFGDLLILGQNLRNSVFHVGRGLSAKEATTAIETLEKLGEVASTLHPLFNNLFKKENGPEVFHLRAA